MFRLVYCLLHNQTPHVFVGDGAGGMLKWSFVQVLETPGLMMAKFLYLLLQHKRTKRHMVVRMAPKGSMVVVFKLSLINEVDYMQLDTLNQTSTYIILSWNSSKYLSLSTFEILAKKVLCKRNLMAKGQVLKVVSTKALPQFSGQGCPEYLWVPTRALIRFSQYFIERHEQSHPTEGVGN